MQMLQRLRRGHWGGTSFCVLLFLVGIALARPVFEAPFSDDFSYIYTAKRAAETGRLIFNGWACPMLGYQVYLGALFIRIFGFSFTATRAAVMLIATLNLVMLHRLFLRVTPRPGNAILAALALALGPIGFTHSLVFFTDVPGEFAFVVALFCAIRAMQAETPSETRRWLLWCVVLNLALGTARQTAWLGSLLLFPAVGWRLRHRGGVLRLTAVLWCGSLVVVALGLRWLSHAPYAPHESLGTQIGIGWPLRWPLLPNLAALEVFPLLVGVLGIREARLNRRMIWCSVAFTAACAAVAWLVPFSAVGDLTFLLLHTRLDRPFALAFVFVVAVLFLGAMAVQEGFVAVRAPSDPADGDASFRDLVHVFWPYLLITTALVTTREAMWARYVLPVTPVLAVLLLRLHAERTKGARLPAFAIAAACVSIAIGVAIAHDDMLMRQPIVRLEAKYEANHLPRYQLEASMEEDGWWELTTGHTVNEPRIAVPADAYHPRGLTREQAKCHMYFLPFSPEIHPVYVISDHASPCYQLPALAVESQTFWLLPQSNVYLFKYIPSQQNL